METLPFGALAAFVGLAGGIVLGLAARLGEFCTLGALETAIYGKDQTRLRIWGIVLAVAVLGTQFGALAGLIDLGAAPIMQLPGILWPRSLAGWCSAMAWHWRGTAALAHWCALAAAICAPW